MKRAFDKVNDIFCELQEVYIADLNNGDANVNGVIRRVALSRAIANALLRVHRIKAADWTEEADE